MWEEQIPSIGRISHVDAGKDGKEVRLEGADGALGGIALHGAKVDGLCVKGCGV